MKYNTIIELDNKIESIIKKTVKYYYSDWKNYDRPKYMKLKGMKPESIFLIVRSCGTYIFSGSELETNESSQTIYRYFTEQEAANVYRITLKNNSINLIHKGIA